MRSKYGKYIEYHTSFDNLDLITPKGLDDSYKLYLKMIEVLENNFYYQVQVLGEPQLGKRGLYPKECKPDTDYNLAFLYRDFLAYADGKNDLMSLGHSHIHDTAVCFFGSNYEIARVKEVYAKNA